MSHPAEDIMESAEREIATIQEPHIRELGRTLLGKWLCDNYTHFCDEVASPEISKLSQEDQLIAQQHLQNIKNTIADNTAHQARRALDNRQSANRMKDETLKTYELIEKRGRGVVFFGSARTKPGESYYDSTEELGYEVSSMLGSTVWTGAGPGQMEAPLKGAVRAGGKIGGIKIKLNNKESHFEQNIASILDGNDVAECKYFGPRKIGLVDAAMRHSEDDRTAVLVTPGGFGTLDELFEFITLKQLSKLGSEYPVPIIIVNYDGYYNEMVRFIYESAIRNGTISERELGLFHIANSNEEVLDILAETYKIPDDERTYNQRIKSVRKPVEPTTTVSA